MNYGNTRLLLLLPLLLLSCKKDLLHWKAADRIPLTTARRLNRILFIDRQNVVIAGGEKFTNATTLVSHDSGFTWTATEHPEAGKSMYGLAASPEGKIIMTGFGGPILTSADLGDSWQFSRLSLGEYYIAAAYPTETHKVVVSTITNEFGGVAHLNEQNEVIHSEQFNFGLNDIVMTDSLTGYLAGYGVILKTVDGGYTWKYLSPRTDDFRSLHVRSPLDVWTCGYSGSILHSIDGGETWERKRNGNDLTIPRYHLECIVFADAQHGYAAGGQGLVIYTDDGGDHWMEFDRFTSEDLHGMAICPDGAVLICGNNGTLYRLSDK